ncbi:hypothetical protein [Alkaliphilus sp. B6464]|uniref:hypothetical protein n=1 Tax=Alkaliphilus sp. B6464 TaxID=2731219 RepID=UPI001BAD3DC8|nr:hypothetical protein [Alkaliphilus sp. B6464]QUH21066.1 hypothetical protein HYG84_15060 [Alkaliphilus sp. B6464]
MLADRVRMSSYRRTKHLIDRTTPVTVVNQPYSTGGNGGRKLVRLSNGWLVACMFNSTDTSIYLYVSKDSGATWSLLTSRSVGTSGKAYSMVSAGTTVYVIWRQSNKFIISGYIDVVRGSSLIGIQVSDTDMAGTAHDTCSLAINTQKAELHACWSSKIETYPNSFNIRYCKGIINPDGSVTWGSVEQVTEYSYTWLDIMQPTIIVKDNSPVIIVKSIGIAKGIAGDYIRGILCYSKAGSTWDHTNIYYTGERGLEQSNPTACVDTDGVIHVAWHGTDAQYPTYNRVRYSKSTDGGMTWNTHQIVNTLLAVYPSISVDTSGNISIVYITQGNNMYYMQFRDTIKTPTQLSTNFLYGDPSSLQDLSIDVEGFPPTAYMLYNKSPITQLSVQFEGKWYE